MTSEVCIARPCFSNARRDACRVTEEAAYWHRDGRGTSDGVQEKPRSL